MFTYKPLSYYAQFLTPEQANDPCGYNGYLLELAVKDFYGRPLVISPRGHLDLSGDVFGHLRRLEVKSNGGDFYNAGKGSSYILYATYIDPDQDLRHQDGCLIPMSLFREVGYALNHIRSEKRYKDSKGEVKVKMSLQTLYNYSKRDYHGRKAEKLHDAWIEGGAVDFIDFFPQA